MISTACHLIGSVNQLAGCNEPGIKTPNSVNREADKL
jgi:hypothetical protein